MKGFNRILYGGDYNPNQWPQEIWNEDMRMFRKAGINSATVNVFSWAKIQPAEEVYDFEELDAVVDMLTREGMDIVLATSTGAMPAWMFKAYPEVARTDFEGRRHKFGRRHNACPNSPMYQKFSAKMALKLAERYSANKNVVCWHINNEYGGECFCENCEKAFRVWLRNKYVTLEALNKAWNFEFWGHLVHSWDEIVLPNVLSDMIDRDKPIFAGLAVDYRRFNSDSMLENYKAERDAIRSIDPDAFITTNFMGTYKPIDYFKWAKEMDVVSWDSYPSYNTPWSFVAMRHDLMRGLKGKPFMLMEQTPSQQNWQPYNSLKKPGQMRAMSYQCMAHGADTIQFFQLRRSLGGCEKFHGAVIEHVGHENTRVFREVAELGHELETLNEIIGAENPAKVGIVFDWDNFWSLEYTSGPNQDLKYVDQLHQYYRYFYERNIPVDMIPVDADFSKYTAVVAPVLYMVKEGMQEALEAYVNAGGVLLTGFMSGIVDQSDNVHLGGYPGPLRKMAGIWVEEIDALAPEQTGALRFADGSAGSCKLLCDIIHLEGASSLADYADNFYANSPAITKNSFGKGSFYYVGTQPDDEALAKVLDMLAAEAELAPSVSERTGLEVTCRVNNGKKYYFVLNLSGGDCSLPAELGGMTDILTGKTFEAGSVLPYWSALILNK